MMRIYAIAAWSGGFKGVGGAVIRWMSLRRLYVVVGGRSLR